MKSIMKILLYMLLISNFSLFAHDNHDNIITKNEQIWLDKQIPVTYVYDIDWAPFEWENEVNRHSGIVADILNIISERSHIIFEPIHTDSWAKAVILAKNNKVDMYSAVPICVNRLEYMNFTSNNIFEYNAALVQNINDKRDYSNLNKVMASKIIAIVRGSTLGKYVKDKYPKAIFMEVEKTINGFQQVRDGTVDLFAINSATADYMINIKGYKDLKIATKLDHKFELKIAISQSMPKEVISIIDKTLGQIHKSEIDAIYNKWMISNGSEVKIDWKTYIYIIVGLFIIMLFLLYRQYILNKANDNLGLLVDKKTKDLEDINKNLELTIENKTEESRKNISLISKYVIFSKTDIKGTIIEVSDAFCVISQFKREDLLGKPHNLIRHPDMPKSAFKQMWKTIQSGKTWKGEVKNLKKDGTYYWVDAEISPEYDKDGNINQYVAIRHDITSKKDFEKQHTQLIQSEKMASMGEMIGNIAHQWRQPLSIISTTATGMKLQKEFNLLTDDDLNESCDRINKNSQYLSQTIDDFRNFIKGDSEKKVFNLKENINSFLHLTKGSTKSNHINMIFDLQDDIKIDGFENELIQCLINIFNNAKDALIENKIEDKYIFISTTINNNNAIIRIKDNAKGIPENIISKIFEPYFTTKHQSQGTGLGLHMSYNLIVDGMKGNIEVKNLDYNYNDEKFTGAEFTISLPCIK